MSLKDTMLFCCTTKHTKSTKKRFFRPLRDLRALRGLKNPTIELTLFLPLEETVVMLLGEFEEV
jgi:hypothetical protein